MIAIVVASALGCTALVLWSCLVASAHQERHRG